MLKTMLRAAYRSLPAKPALFSLLRRVYVPPPRVYEHLHFSGVFTAFVRSAGATFRMRHEGHVLENRVFWDGVELGWEPASMSVWLMLARQASVIVEFGPNAGLYALAAQAVQPSATVFAIEPVHREWARLRANAALNRFPIVCVDAAASNANGFATLLDGPGDRNFVATLEQPLERNAAHSVIPIEVRTVTIESILQNHPVAELDVIKIDVEGHEPAVIEGIGRFLERRPAMIVEVAETAAADAIEAMLPPDYQFFSLDDRVGRVRRVDHVRDVRARGNCLLCDTERTVRLGFVGAAAEWRVSQPRRWLGRSEITARSGHF